MLCSALRDTGQRKIAVTKNSLAWSGHAEAVEHSVQGPGADTALVLVFSDRKIELIPFFLFFLSSKYRQCGHHSFAHEWSSGRAGKMLLSPKEAEKIIFPLLRDLSFLGTM